MIRIGPSLRTILSVNVRAFMAMGLLYLGKWIWPDTLEWWGFAPTALLLWVAMFALAMSVCRAIAQQIQNDLKLSKLNANRRDPSADEMVTHADLKKGGLLK